MIESLFISFLLIIFIGLFLYQKNSIKKKKEEFEIQQILTVNENDLVLPSSNRK